MKTEKINLHTHCTFCDGKNSAEEMVLSAIEKNFTIIGFSSHCIYPLTSDFYKTPDDEWHIPENQIQNYLKEINRLKEKYSGQIKIFTGFEADYFEAPEIGSAIPDFDVYKPLNPDFLIGSVHFVNTPKGFYTVDHTVENIRENLIKLYADSRTGLVDGKKAVCEYFEAERQMLAKGKFNIVGHPDLIRKRNGVLKLFDENESWYREEIQLTAKAIAKAGVVAEINTGAIARGTMDDVYPSAAFLELLHSYGVPVCINSDCHNAPDLDCAFDRARHIAKKIGYSELLYPIGNQELIIKF